MRAILAALSNAPALRETLRLVTSQAMQWLGPCDVVIGVLDPATTTILVCAAQGLRANTEPKTLLRSGEQAFQHALLLRSPVLLPVNGNHVETGSPPGAEPTVLAVPMPGGDDLPRGGLLLYYDTPPQLSPRELELATLFSAQAALAIERAEEQANGHTHAVISERNRIARDLHDSVTQMLYTMSLIAESLPVLWQSNQQEALQSLETLRLSARSALVEMRTLLLELRPLDQPDCNLGDLLQQLPDRMLIRSKVQISTSITGHAALPKHVQVSLYYIAQEALNNIDKHAHATRASIQLEYPPQGGVVLRISDNGCGIDPEKRTASQLGLGIIAERASAIGAAHTIASRPGQGTLITVVWHGASE